MADSPQQNGTGQDTAASGTRENLASIHAETVARHTGQGVKRPVGRPRKDQSASTAKGAAVAQPAAAAPVLPPFAPGVVEKAVEALCKTTDRLVQRKVYALAFQLTDDKGLSMQHVQDVAMGEETRQQIAALSEAVCLQYGILGQHAPAAFLAITVISYGTNVFLTLNKLEELARLNAQKTSHGATATQPPAK